MFSFKPNRGLFQAQQRLAQGIDTVIKPWRFLNGRNKAFYSSVNQSLMAGGMRELMKDRCNIPGG